MLWGVTSNRPGPFGENRNIWICKILIKYWKLMNSKEPLLSQASKKKIFIGSRKCLRVRWKSLFKIRMTLALLNFETWWVLDKKIPDLNVRVGVAKLLITEEKMLIRREANMVRIEGNLPKTSNKKENRQVVSVPKRKNLYSPQNLSSKSSNSNNQTRNRWWRDPMRKIRQKIRHNCFKC